MNVPETPPESPGMASGGLLILTESYLQVSSLFRLVVASHEALLHGLGVHAGNR